MEIRNYALGLRFDTRKMPIGDPMQHAFEMICSVLSYEEVANVPFHGGFPYPDEPHAYTVVLEGEHYKQVRSLFRLFQYSPVEMFLCDKLPYIDKNRILELKNMTPYGIYDYVHHKLTNAPIPVFNVDLSLSRLKMEGRHFTFMFAPDSFKGTISSKEAVNILTLAANESHFRGCDIIPLPIADGGEGTLDAILPALNGKTVYTNVHDPLGRVIEAQYGIINDDTAVIEMAKASGLCLVAENERDIRNSSTYGTGELIMHAINHGIRKITLACGGSATNDCGMGMASAMGVKFLNKNGEEITPCGNNLIFIHDIDMSYVSRSVRETEFTVMCDVENPLTGINGATYVYGPQKGADAKAMFDLECGMKNIRRHLNNKAGYDICSKPGMGAAGGTGAILMALFRAKIRHGIDTVLDLCEFDKKARNVSLVITGEGRLDMQTLQGNKAVSGIIKRAKGKVPVAVVCGSSDREAMRELNNTGIVTVAHSFDNNEDYIHNAKEYFYDAAKNMFTLLYSGSEMKKKL